MKKSGALITPAFTPTPFKLCFHRLSANIVNAPCSRVVKFAYKVQFKMYKRQQK